MEITNTTYLVLGLLTCVNALLAIACLVVASAKKRRDAVTIGEHDTKMLDNDYFETDGYKINKKNQKKIAFIGKIQPGKRKADKSKKKKQ